MIATLFIEIAQRTEKCFDFEIQKWLDKYEELRQHPNFSEAALLISSASMIYARKVDYLGNLILEMGAKEHTDTGGAEQDQTKMVRRGRPKKYRPKTITDHFDEIEFVVKEITKLPKSKLLETVQRKESEFNSHWEKFKTSQCRFLKNKKNKIVVSKKITENSELIATNATFGRDHIYDYDGEEIVGAKNDFRCFSNIIDESYELVQDYNFTKQFDHIDSVDQEEERRQALGLPPDRRCSEPRKFQFYLSNEYMKQNYNIDVENAENKAFKKSALACGDRNVLLDDNIQDFSDMLPEDERVTSNVTSPEPEGGQVSSNRSTVSVDSAVQSLTDVNHRLESIAEENESESNTFFDATFEPNDSGCVMDSTASMSMEERDFERELEQYNLNKDKTTDIGRRLPSVDHDEGISLHSMSVQSPCDLSETDGPALSYASSMANFDAVLKSSCNELFQQIRDSSNKLVLQVRAELFTDTDEPPINKNNLLEIEERYLRHEEEFQLPLEYVLKPATVDINFLKLPEARLRRRCIFALPPKDFNLKPRNVKMPPEPKQPRVFRLEQFNAGQVDGNNMDTDTEDFLGFTDQEMAGSFASSSLSTSTPKKPVAEAVIRSAALLANDGQSLPVQQAETVELLEVDEQTLQVLEEQSLKRKAEDELNQGSAKRPSIDSDLMTDDESLGGDQQDNISETDAVPVNESTTNENLSTPERIKKATEGIRVSRDSGITSPSPEPTDEVLTVEVSDPQPRRESSETDDSYETADNAEQPPEVSFSKHDQELVEQAQQRYQDQVSEMQGLVEKVNRWHQNLKPVLKEAQERGHFEIHEYGSKVLDSFKSDGTECSFADVMEDKPRNSIARFFLSTLMLVNTGNIEMTSLNNDPQRITKPEELKLKLKNRTRLHETLEHIEEALPSSSSSRKRQGSPVAKAPNPKKHKPS